MFWQRQKSVESNVEISGFAFPEDPKTVDMEVGMLVVRNVFVELPPDEFVKSKCPYTELMNMTVGESRKQLSYATDLVQPDTAFFFFLENIT